jgi:hypothetical protein
MKRFCCGLLATTLLAPVPLAVAAATNSAPDFLEVQALIRDHLAGVDQAALDRAAVRGLLSEFAQKVSWIESDAAAQAIAPTPRLAKAEILEDDVAYLRVAGVGDGLAAEISTAAARLASTNRHSGILLDLRFAGGTDYSAAVSAADLFIARAQPLLDWGTGMVSAPQNSNVIPGPLVILVNRQTAGAAEALAAILREAGAALILGGGTAGQAMMAQEFPLKNGGRLRIATKPIELGDGSKLSESGVKPDIDVPVSAEEEKKFYANSFAFTVGAKTAGVPTGTVAGTNSAARRAKPNEAELVRAHKQGRDNELFDGEIPASLQSPRSADAEKPLVTDPVLARGLDLLKGLAVVRQSHF